jgi:hypothetical protein
MSRLDPRQASFLATLVRPAPGPDHDFGLEALIRQHLTDMTGPGIPSCVEYVWAVWREGDAVVADIEVFDGEVHRVRVRGTRDTIRQYSWSQMPVPLGWDSKAKRWRRYPVTLDRRNS